MRDASKFDNGYYGKLLGKARDEVAFIFRDCTVGSMFEKIRLLSRCKNRTLSPYTIIGDYERFFSLGSS